MRILDDYGQPGWMLDDLGRPEGEWELKLLRGNIVTDFEPIDCNSDTMAKKLAFAKYPGRDLGKKMDAAYREWNPTIGSEPETVAMECHVCHRTWQHRWYWHTCPDCAAKAFDESGDPQRGPGSAPGGSGGTAGIPVGQGT